MIAPDFAANRLALEPILIDLIATQVTGLSEVGGPAKFGRALQKGVKSASAYVLFSREIVEPAPPGSHALPQWFSQVWEVALMVPITLSDEVVSNAPAGALMSALIATLTGWTWDATHHSPRLERINTDADQTVYTDGYVHLFLTFQVSNLVLN